MTLDDLTALERRIKGGSNEAPGLPSLHRLTPESQRQVARVLHAMHLRGDSIDIPPWRAATARSADVAIAFLRLELALRPQSFAGSTSALLVEALRRTMATDLRPEQVRPVVEMCLDQPDTSLHQHALNLLDQHSERVDPRSLMSLYERLVDTHLAPVAVDRMLALEHRIPAFAAFEGLHRSRASIRAHGQQGDRDLLLRLAEDQTLPDDLRASVILALGDCAERRDVSTLLGICSQQPERLAAACGDALTRLRHRGIFLQTCDLPGAFQLALHAPIPLAALTTHLRAERARYLSTVAPDDPRFPVWLLAFDKPDHGLTDVLTGLTQSSSYGTRTAALKLLSQPDTRNSHTRVAAERAVLACRSNHPDEARRALAVVGGEETCAVLGQQLATHGLQEPWVAVLVGLLKDGDPRIDDLETSLNAGSWSTEPLWHVPRGQGPSMVRLGPGMDAHRLFMRLCDAGSLTVVPHILKLLREHTAALVNTSEPQNATSRSYSPLLSRSILAALGNLATDVQRRGGLAPLIGHRSQAETPRAFAAWILTRALDAVEDPNARAVIVRSIPLEGVPASDLISWGRTGDPELRRDVVTRMGEHADVVALGAAVLKAMTHPDARVARAGARAAVRMRLLASVPALLELLDRPRMELKRIAARGLAIVGDGRAVMPLVRWLGRHDNRGFRDELLTALQTCLPAGVRGLLMAKANAASGRTAALLLHAVASLDEPDRRRTLDATEDTKALRTPLLLRAQAFTDDPSQHTFEELFSSHIDSLSVDAECLLKRLEEPLFDVLQSLAPTQRQPCQTLGRAVGNFLMWTTTYALASDRREGRIAQLRRLPTFPMGAARWTALRRADALMTVSDVLQALDDCTFSAHRDTSMATLLNEAALREEEIQGILSASDDERTTRVRKLFHDRPVLGWTRLASTTWAPPPEPLIPAETVGNALRTGTPIPDEWPWAPASWANVVKTSGHQRPTAYPALLRGLFTRALPDLASTPDRVAWARRWPNPPSPVRQWAQLPEPVQPSRIHRSPHSPHASFATYLPIPEPQKQSFKVTLADVLSQLQTPGEQRRALRALEQFPGPEATEVVRPFLDQRHLRAAALRCFRRVAPRADVCDVLRAMLKDRDDAWVRACGRTLAFMRDPTSTKSFVELLSHRSAGVRTTAREALALMPDHAIPILRRAVSRARPDHRAGLQEVLDALQDPGAW